jgi:hypothetical protein
MEMGFDCRWRQQRVSEETSALIATKFGFLHPSPALPRTHYAVSLSRAEYSAAGHSPMFCPAGFVTSEFPVTDEGGRPNPANTLEVGSSGADCGRDSRLLLTGIRRRKVGLLVLALDAPIPALSLLALMVLSFLLVDAGTWRLGTGSAAFVASLTAFLGLIVATTGWLNTGQSLLTPTSAFTIAGAFFKRIPFYWMLIRRDRSGWIRAV